MHFERWRIHRALRGVYRQLNERAIPGPGVRGVPVSRSRLRMIHDLTEDQLLLHIRARIPQVLAKNDLREATYILGLYQGLSYRILAENDSQ